MTKVCGFVSARPKKALQFDHLGAKLRVAVQRPRRMCQKALTLDPIMMMFCRITWDQQNDVIFFHRRPVKKDKNILKGRSLSSFQPLHETIVGVVLYDAYK